MAKTYFQLSNELKEFAIPRALAGVGIGTIAKAAARGAGRIGFETLKTAGSAISKAIGFDTSAVSGIIKAGANSAKERIELQRQHDREVFECPRQVSTANRSTNTTRNYITNIEKKLADARSASPPDPEEISTLESALADARDSLQAAEDYELDIKEKCRVLTRSKSAVAAQKGVQRFERGRADQARTQLACNQCVEKQLKAVGIDLIKATDVDKEVAKRKCKECKTITPKP